MAEPIDGHMPDPVAATAEAGQRALERQPGALRRKDTLTALVVLVGYVATSISNTDFSAVESWVPTVGAWLFGIIGIGIHALTKGPVTPAVVEAIVYEAEQIAKHRR